jgi:AcrR family transcriptional regulator
MQLKPNAIPDDVTNTPLSKGESTRVAILDAALSLAAKDGLEGLTIGTLADRMQMSKSGVFSHFGSREDLQLEVVREYHRRFELSVFKVALLEPKGLPRLEKMLSLWMKLRIDELNSGCIYISGAVEFDDRPGAVRDQLILSVRTWRSALEKAITQSIEEGHFRKDCNPKVMLFQIYSFVLGLHHDVRFLKNPGSINIAHSMIQKVINENRVQH